MTAVAGSCTNGCHPPVADGRPFVMSDPEGRPLGAARSRLAALTWGTLSGFRSATAPGAAVLVTSCGDCPETGSDAVEPTGPGTSSARRLGVAGFQCGSEPITR